MAFFELSRFIPTVIIGATPLAAARVTVAWTSSPELIISR
jgi:hypothetical protein